MAQTISSPCPKTRARGRRLIAVIDLPETRAERAISPSAMGWISRYGVMTATNAVIRFVAIEGRVKLPLLQQHIQHPHLAAEIELLYFRQTSHGIVLGLFTSQSEFTVISRNFR
jgi:hypothetical protein